MEQAAQSLNGKKVIILGGSAGIGLATAQAAAQAGATVVIVSSSQDKLNNALTTLPSTATAHAVNLSDEAAIKALFTTIGNFDHLIYTAGENLIVSPIAEMPVADAQKFTQVRYWGAFTAVKYAAPLINKGGSVVLTGGSAGKRPGKGWALAASICAGMEGLTRALAVELAPIRVNIVVPGLVKTDLWGNMPTEDRDGMFTHFATVLPVQHVATPDEIALSYIHLMNAAYITGQQIIADGGYTLV